MSFFFFFKEGSYADLFIQAPAMQRDLEGEILLARQIAIHKEILIEEIKEWDFLRETLYKDYQKWDFEKQKWYNNLRQWEESKEVWEKRKEVWDQTKKRWDKEADELKREYDNKWFGKSVFKDPTQLQIIKEQEEWDRQKKNME